MAQTTNDLKLMENFVDSVILHSECCDVHQLHPLKGFFGDSDETQFGKKIKEIYEGVFERWNGYSKGKWIIKNTSSQYLSLEITLDNEKPSTINIKRTPNKLVYA